MRGAGGGGSSRPCSLTGCAGDEPSAGRPIPRGPARPQPAGRTSGPDRTCPHLEPASRATGRPARPRAALPRGRPRREPQPTCAARRRCSTSGPRGAPTATARCRSSPTRWTGPATALRFFGVHYKATRDAGPRLRGRLRRALPVGPRRGRRPDRARAAGRPPRRRPSSWPPTGRWSDARSARSPRRASSTAGRALPGRAAVTTDATAGGPGLPGWLHRLHDAASTVRPGAAEPLPAAGGGRPGLRGADALRRRRRRGPLDAGRRRRPADRALARDAQPRRPGRLPRRRDRPGGRRPGRGGAARGRRGDRAGPRRRRRLRDAAGALPAR